MRNLTSNAPVIYVVTAITKIYPYLPEDLHDYSLLEEYRCVNQLGFHRCMGWFPTLKEAEAALQQQTPHLHKDFEWFVIEKTLSTFYAEVVSRTCYHWETKRHRYIRTSEPECLKDYPNLGLG